MKPNCCVPSVSVVIPARNAGHWIGDALGSVLSADSLPDHFEVIVIDDGSTDRTRDIATQTLQRSSITWRIETVGPFGASKARNIGWREACGEWIQFLDADDIITPSKFRVQLPVAVQAGPNVAVVYSTWGNFEQKDCGWKCSPFVRTPYVGNDPILDLLKTENFIATGAQLIRRNWLERVNGFDERHSFIEDVDLALRLAMTGAKFVRAEADEPVLLYRQHAASLSRSNSLAFWEGCVRNARMAEDHWRIDGGLSPEQSRCLLEVYGIALRVLFEHDRREFFRLLRHVRELDRHYCPGAPSHLRRLSQLIGYPAAELAALTYRRVKRSVVPG